MYSRRIRVLSYNIHKGFGPGSRNFTLHKIRVALQRVDADVVFLQEVVGRHDAHAARITDWPIAGQLEVIADKRWPHQAYGRNAVYEAGHHGNAILSRFPILEWSNHDISQHQMESRGVLACTLDYRVGDGNLRCFCAHLGLLRRWRTRQTDDLCRIVAQQSREEDALIIAGDFNDWRDHLSMPLQQRLGVREALRAVGCNGRRTYPGAMPLFAIDRIYYRHVRPVTARTLRGHPWRALSDHAAVYAEFIV